MKCFMSWNYLLGQIQREKKMTIHMTVPGSIFFEINFFPSPLIIKLELWFTRNVIFIIDFKWKEMKWLDVTHTLIVCFVLMYFLHWTHSRTGEKETESLENCRFCWRCGGKSVRVEKQTSSCKLSSASAASSSVRAVMTAKEHLMTDALLQYNIYSKYFLTFTVNFIHNLIFVN